MRGAQDSMPKRNFIRPVTLLFFGICFAYAQDGQAPSFRSRADVVLVPVVVRSKQGAVENLKPEQFSITEDGKPQKIASVELIRADGKVRRPSASGVYSNELDASGPARLLIIGVDTINTPFLDQANARQQLLKFVANSLESGEQAAVFTMHRDGSVRMLHDVTGDSATLSAAIKGMAGVVTGGATNPKSDPPYSRRETELAVMSQQKNKNLGAGDPELERAVDEAQAFEAFKDSTSGGGAFELRRNMEATLESMRQIAEAFAGVSGRKSFLWITGSFPFDISTNAELLSPKSSFYGFSQETGNYYSEHNGALPPLPESASVVGDDVLNPMRHEFRRLLQQFSAANIALYPIDARGLMTLNFDAGDSHPNVVLSQLDRERAQMSQSTMNTFARMTGGKSCYNQNEIANCVRDAEQDGAAYYLLSYYRDKKNNKEGWRSLAVKVEQPDVDVRARTGYFFGNGNSDKNARVREVGAAARSSVQFSGVPFSARFLGTSPDGKKKQIKYEMFIPPQTVNAADQADGSLELEVVALASTATEPQVDAVTETLGKNLTPAVLAAIHKEGISYTNVLKLAPGQYQVHFIARNAATGEVGSVIAPLKVE